MPKVISIIFSLAFLTASCGQETSILVEEVPEGNLSALQIEDDDALGNDSDLNGTNGSSQSNQTLETANFGKKSKTKPAVKATPKPDIEPETISIAINSQSIKYGVSNKAYAYEVAVTTNDVAGYNLELLSAPPGFTLTGSSLVGMYNNPDNMEYTDHQVSLRATSISDSTKSSTQTYNLRIASVCQESIENMVSIITLDESGNRVTTPLGSFAAYSGSLSAADNYFYDSASANPIVGPTPQGFFGSTFMYIEPNGDSYLNIFWGMDNGGSADTRVNVDVKTTGNDGLDNVVLSDDGGEMVRVSSSTAESNYQGRFRYWKNTDGAVIGPFVGTNYKIEVTMLEGGDNTNAKFYSQDGSDLTLIDNGSLASYEITFANVRTCQ